MSRWYAAFLERFDQISRIVVVTCMTVMIVVVSTQVVLRYLFNSSVDCADEVARLAFVWAIFLAIPLGIRQGAHVGIELLVARLPSALRTWLARLMSLLAAVLMAVVFYEGIRVAAETWDERLPTLDLTSSTFFVAVIISAGHSFLHLVQLLWRSGGKSEVSAE